MDEESYNRLTDTQRLYLRLFSRYTAKEIAQQVSRSLGTVDTQLRRGAAKLGLLTPQAAAYALVEFEAGLSGQSGTEANRHDIDPPALHNEGVDQPSIVREERAAFDLMPASDEPERASLGQRFYDLTDNFTITQGLVAIAIIAALVLIIIALAFSVSSGFQGVAHSIRPAPR